jgi:hypothetical protein
MDFDYFIISVFGVGLLTLFFFPSPESNFLWYVFTALGFTALIGVLIWIKKNLTVRKPKN